MTGKDRALNCMRNKHADRISVHPAIDVSYAARLFGRKVGECFTDPRLHARALENVFSVHPEIDGLYVNLCLSPRSCERKWNEGDEEYFLDTGGMTWYIPPDDVGSVKSHRIKKMDDPLLITQNPLKDGILETYNAISGEIKNKYLIVPGLTGPFSQLVFMVGLTETLLLIYDQPDELKQALEWRTRQAIEWADIFIESGVDCVWIGEGAASSSIISPDMYAEFVLPYARSVVEHLNLNGIVTIMHVCGDINKSAGIIAGTGVDAMDIDFMVDLETARKSIARPVCLRGNLSPMDLLTMDRDQIAEKCRKIMDTAGSPFVLSTGCVVARDTPPENINAMVDASVSYTNENI